MKGKLITFFKKHFKVLIYISLAFVIVALIKADYLKIPRIHSYLYLFLSFLFLFIGFIFQCLNWYFILKKKYPVSLKDALISFGLYVFTKYIPGKLLVIVGKAGHIHNKYKYPLKDMIARSLDAQFIVLWAGILVGSCGLFYTDDALTWALPLILGWIVLTLLIFTDIFHGILKKTVYLLTRKEINIPFISFKEAVSILPVYFLYWICFMAAFLFFSLSLSEVKLSFAVAFGFPLAVTLGIIILIAPGGLGFREGVLVAYLTMLSVNLQDATTISVSSRLWFLSGEIFIFLLAVLLNRLKRNK